MKPIAQTVHGYRDGHRELGRSGPLTKVEASLIDRFSDLSGYLPTGLAFDRYISGYPCGRYYALAATWPDPLAPRAGAVLTHTVLFAQTTARFAPLSSLYAWLHRPASALETPVLEASCDGLTADWLDDEVSDLRRLRGLLRRFFSSTQRPVVWIDAEPTEALIAHIWELLPVGDQRNFAFCSLALGERALVSRPFDLLCVPPAARGRIGAGVAVAVDRERSIEQEAGPAPDWMQALLVQGRTALDELDRLLALDGLRLRGIGLYARAFRFVRLRDSSEIDLVAARARADLLELLWPELPESHLSVRGVLETLLRQIPSAAPVGKPWWEWQDFLGREWVRRLLRSEPDFAERVAECLCYDAGSRLDKGPSLWTSWVSLVAALPEPLRSAAEKFSVTRIVAASATSATLTEVWLRGRPEENLHHFMEEIAVAHAPEERVTWALALLDLRPESLAALVSIAKTFADGRLGLALLGRSGVGSEVDAFRVVSSWPGVATQDISGLVGHEAWIEWLLTDAPLLAWRAHSARTTAAINALRLGPLDLLANVGDTDRGHVVISAVGEMLDGWSVGKVAKQWPGLMRPLVGLPKLTADEESVGRAVAAVDVAVWLDSTWLEQLEHLDTYTGDLSIARVLPAVLLAADAQGIVALLCVAAVRRFLASHTDSQLYRDPGRPELLAQILAASLTALDRAPNDSFTWLIPLIRPLLAHGPRHDLQSCEDSLAKLLERIHGETLIVLGREVVLRIRAQSELIERDAVLVPIIAPLHRRLLVTDVFDGRWNWGWSWDRAQVFREWLAELWLKRDWSGGNLARAAAYDSELILPLLGWFTGRRRPNAKRILVGLLEEIEEQPGWSEGVRTAARLSSPFRK